MNLHAYSLFWDFPSKKNMLITHHTLTLTLTLSIYVYKHNIPYIDIFNCEGVFTAAAAAAIFLLLFLLFFFYFSKTCNLNFVDKMSFAAWAWAWASNKWEMSGSFLEFHLKRRSCFNMINERIQKTCFYWMVHSSKQLSIVEILCIIISKANLNTHRSSWLWCGGLLLYRN